jgi:hypothetical protein
MVRTTTRGQSVYPDIAPFISIYCCQVEMRWCLVVQRHLCFQRKRGYNSTTNRALKIYRSCIEYTRLPRDHFRPMIFLEVCQKQDMAKQFQRRRFFRNHPIRNRNCMWWPCLLIDRDKMSNFHRGHSVDASYQVSVVAMFVNRSGRNEQSS